MTDVNGYTIEPYADLTGANLTGADLSDANLGGADLTGANLTGADLSDANLMETNLSDANLGGANLESADLTGADLTNTDLEGANLGDAYLTGAVLSDAGLENTNLTGADLTEADLTGAILTGANLTRANLTEADLTEADLTNTDLTRADLTGSDLTDVDLTGANLTGADLTNSISLNTNLSNANLTDAKLISLKMPDGYEIPQDENIFVSQTGFSSQYGEDKVYTGDVESNISVMWDGEFKLEAQTNNTIKYYNVIELYSRWDDENVENGKLLGDLNWGAQESIQDTFRYFGFGSGYTSGDSLDQRGNNNLVQLTNTQNIETIQENLENGHWDANNPSSYLSGWDNDNPSWGLEFRILDFFAQHISYWVFEIFYFDYFYNYDHSGQDLDLIETGSSSTLRLSKQDGKKFTLNNFNPNNFDGTGIYSIISDGEKYTLNGLSNTHSTIEEFLAEYCSNIEHVDFEIKQAVSLDDIQIIMEIGPSATNIHSFAHEYNDIAVALNEIFMNYQNSFQTNRAEAREQMQTAIESLNTEVEYLQQEVNLYSIYQIEFISDSSLVESRWYIANINVRREDDGLVLTNADLTGADLTGADLRSTDFTGADLTNVKSGNIIGNPTLDTNYSIVSGYIIGPSVDLTGADLKEVDLTNTNLSNVTLTDADLRLANLSGANMTNVTIGESTTPLPPLQFVKKDLRNRSIQNVKISSLENSIIDSTTNFAGADLTDVDFSNVIFKGSSGDRQKALDAGWTDEELRAIGWSSK